ncbi:MAG: zinc ribbon domain-containing protein [Phycisphaeraceae bacterium]|nr:zinc ribbon domain-containing protein [Phycisphaeraceae bacterium]
MPIYEYICQDDGEVIELLRPMSQADDPVHDPRGLGRTFVRKHSTFASRGAADNTRASGTGLPMHQCGRCGKPGGGCGG